MMLKETYLDLMFQLIRFFVNPLILQAIQEVEELQLDQKKYHLVLFQTDLIKLDLQGDLLQQNLRAFTIIKLFQKQLNKDIMKLL